MNSVMKKIIYTIVAAFLVVSCNTGDISETGLPIVETLPVTVATSSTAVLRGSTSGGTANMLCRGVCFSKSNIYSFTDSHNVSVDAGEGIFEVKTYELDPMQKYNMKAFAVMKDGKIIYGEEMTFSTTDFMLPSVTIGPVTDIYANEATFNGTLADEGDYPVLSTGFVYTSNASAVLETGNEGVESILATLSGSEFKVSVGDLAIGQEYRVRAFAMTSYGTGYSEEMKFSTLNIKPMEFSGTEILENTYTSLKIKSSITDYHGSTVSSRGFCWSSDNKLPTIKNSNYKETGEGFEMEFENVRPGLVYYIRPYAVSPQTGISYGVTIRVKVKTYDCDGGMIKIVPKNPVYIGWLGDPDSPTLPAKYSQAHDGSFVINMSVGRNSTPTPSEATVKPYCIGKYEVTNRWFCEFLNVYGSSTVKEGTWQGQAILFDAYTDIKYADGKWTTDEEYADCPAVGVTWFGAMAFCEFFGGYLPSEAQWEIAARGNVYSDDPSAPMFRYSGSNDLSEVAIWAGETARPRCVKVGQKKPNQLGIYDMSGNAQEMTSSWWGNYSATYKENVMNSTKSIVLRGGRAQRGGTQNMPLFQVNARDSYAVETAVAYNNYIGFRFACNPDDEI